MALNATIEAGRAVNPERIHGRRGSKVAWQPNRKATEEMAEQIGSIRCTAADAPQASEQVDAVIRELSLIATMVGVTVDQQNLAVASIVQPRLGRGRVSVTGFTIEARSTTPRTSLTRARLGPNGSEPRSAGSSAMRSLAFTR